MTGRPVVGACLQRCVVRVHTISSKQREAGLAPIATRSRDENTAQPGDFLLETAHHHRVLLRARRHPVRTFFVSAQFSTHLDYCQMDLCLMAAMPH